MNIVLAVTGGIAAYKTPELVRLLVKSGHEVKVILSKGAQDFVTPMTLETVSLNPVYSEVASAGNALIHIDLARWADLLVVAPLTANRMAAMAHGFADDLLTTMWLAYEGPTLVAPAMNKQMWEHPCTQENLEKLKGLGVDTIGPGDGSQACQEVGPGRMSEPQDIANAIESLSKPKDLEGLSILVSAGPTVEPVDPVRYLSNRSSGKMGYAIAQAAKARGAIVTLVTGPCHIDTPSGVQVVRVTSAKEMFEAVTERMDWMDIYIGAAAVADYRVAKVSEQKIKKGDPLNLEMVQNPDILKTVAQGSNRPFCVGFAAETEHGDAYAKDKLVQKGCDMIALNAINQPGCGFDTSTNQLSIYWPKGEHHLAMAPKTTIAHQLLTVMKERWNEYDHPNKNP